MAELSGKNPKFSSFYGISSMIQAYHAMIMEWFPAWLAADRWWILNESYPWLVIHGWSASDRNNHEKVLKNVNVEFSNKILNAWQFCLILTSWPWKTVPWFSKMCKNDFEIVRKWELRIEISAKQSKCHVKFDLLTLEVECQLIEIRSNEKNKFS